MKSIVVLSLVLLTISSSLAKERYRLPPQGVVDLVDAPDAAVLQFSPDGAWILELQQSPLPTIADLSRPMLRLAGTRIDPAADGPYRTSYYEAVSLRDLTGKRSVRIPLPAGARLAASSWSHDSRWFLLTLVGDSGTALLAANVEQPDRLRAVTQRLNSVVGSSFAWMPDGQSLIVSEVPESRGPPPEQPSVPEGPSVRETSGQQSPLRTYQDLLSNPHDEALFRHYGTSQLVHVDLNTGERKPLSGPALHAGVDPAPDGRHVLLTTLHHPFSYVMPWWSFPQSIEVLDLSDGKRHLVVDVPLGEGIPVDGVRLGPRSLSWRPGATATLVYLEALDGGDPDREAAHRDRWMMQAAPFDQPAVEFLRIEHRARSLSWFPGGEQLFASEYDRDRRWVRSTLHDLGADPRPPRVVEDRSQRDRYGDPGRVIEETDVAGQRVVRVAEGRCFRSGSGAMPGGARPFFDRQNLTTLETERLWQCEQGVYESVSRLIATPAGALPQVVTRRESITEPPNYLLRDLGQPRKITPITLYSDPTPQIRGIHKQLVTYERDDGVPLSATLYLPADYQEGTRLPLLVWAYPLEYNDAKTAGQISGSPYRFTRFRGASHLYLLTQGYAIMDGATMPVIGDPETMNDTFIAQIVAAAQAAIDKAVELGVADPNRVGVGGHSYGAFMTANLLAHCDLFRAGVARSGAYNRTLTPFGFQSERRTFWEAPEAYFKVSPFMHAHQINEPLLMIHGEVDNNSGTFPMQSERMFSAIQGNGGTARLVVLPNESHGYSARESVLQTLSEMIDWFDQHVKDGEKPEG